MTAGFVITPLDAEAQPSVGPRLVGRRWLIAFPREHESALTRLLPRTTLLSRKRHSIIEFGDPKPVLVPADFDRDPTTVCVGAVHGSDGVVPSRSLPQDRLQQQEGAPKLCAADDERDDAGSRVEPESAIVLGLQALGCRSRCPHVAMGVPKLRWDRHLESGWVLSDNHLVILHGRRSPRECSSCA
jgi:hypothetical protein